MRSQAQYTIYSLNDVYTGNTAPQNPYTGQLWVDTSQNPPLTKVFNGTTWKEQNGTDTLKSNVQTLTTKQSTFETNLSGLTSTVSQHTQTITGLEDDLNTAKEDINVLESDVSILQQTTSTISAEVSNKANSVYGNSSSSFGWKLQSSGFELYSNQNTVMKVNSSGLEINGKIASIEGTIGGFNISSNSLYAGTPGSDSGIELTSISLIGYRSNSENIHSTQAVSKITINKAMNLVIYIRSYAESNFDYTIASKVNAASFPTTYTDSTAYANTRGKQQSGKALSSYTKVEYTGLKSGDFIYIVYRKDGSASSGDDRGYVLVPDTSDISVASNGGTYYFVRDTSLDIKGASIKVGSNFSVDNTGALTSKSGKIGNLEINSSGLKYSNNTYGSFSIGEQSTDDRLPKYAISATSMRINSAYFGFKSDGYYGQYWSQLDQNGLSIYYTDGNEAASCKTNISIQEMMRIPAFENIFPTAGRHIRIWCGRMSLAQDAWGSINLGGYFSTISYVYATCQATSSNESLSGTKGICMTYISGTTVYIANDGSGTRYVTYIVIGY